MKTFLTSLIVLQTVAGFAATEASQTNSVLITPELLSRLADEAGTNNPALKAARARVGAAEANAKTVRTWEDPTLMVGAMAAERTMRAEDGDLIYGVEQKIPLFGKPQAERRVAQAETRVQERTANTRFQQVRRDLALALFRAALADRIVEIGQQDVAWLETLAAVVQNRYESGGATTFDVLRLQNERARRQTRLDTDRELLKQERFQLNRLLNRPFEAPWPVLLLPAVASPIPYSEKLADLAVRNEPELATRHEEVRQSEAAVAAARRQRYPDFAAGAELRNYSGNGELRQSMFTLSFNIPWGRSYSAAVKREHQKLEAVRFDTDDAELSLRNEIHHLTVKIDAARREAIAYRDQIIPRGETALESARTAWEANRGTFSDLLEARRMLLEAQLMQARAVTEQYQMLSDLVLCCGLGDFGAIEMIGAQPANNLMEKKEP